jgi:hypothetical protein
MRLSQNVAPAKRSQRRPLQRHHEDKKPGEATNAGHNWIVLFDKSKSQLVCEYTLK